MPSEFYLRYEGEIPISITVSDMTGVEFPDLVQAYQQKINDSDANPIFHYKGFYLHAMTMVPHCELPDKGSATFMIVDEVYVDICHENSTPGGDDVYIDSFIVDKGTMTVGEFIQEYNEDGDSKRNDMMALFSGTDRLEANAYVLDYIFVNKNEDEKESTLLAKFTGPMDLDYYMSLDEDD